MSGDGEGKPLTEVEGAILSEVMHRGHRTAFQVRRAFELSPSLEWSGSAGAIYPAIKRLRERGLLSGEATGDGRATVHLTLTAAGEAAMLDWACAADRASSVGLDPFRLRAGIWTQLPTERRAAAMRDAAAAIAENIAFLEEYVRDLDDVEAARVELSLAMQRLRLDYLSRGGANSL